MIGAGFGHAAAAALVAEAAVDFVVVTLDDVEDFEEVAELPHATSSTAAGTRSAAKIRFIRESNQTDRSQLNDCSTVRPHGIATACNGYHPQV